MSTRQRWLTSRGPRNTPMHRMSKTFFQSGPIKEQVPLLRPDKFGNPHRLSHLDLSRLLLCSRLSKTSFTLHNLPRTSSSLPSLQRKHSLASRTGKHLDRVAPTLTCFLNQWHSNSVINSRICLGPRLPRPKLHSLSSVKIPNKFKKRVCLGNSNQLVAISISLTLNNSAGNHKLTRLSNHNKKHMLIV